MDPGGSISTNYKTAAINYCSWWYSISWNRFALHQQSNKQTHAATRHCGILCLWGGEGGTKQIWLFQQIMGRVRNISVLLQNWGGGGYKHISVLLQNWGVRNILGLGQNRGYETFWPVIFRGTKHVNISWKGVRKYFRPARKNSSDQICSVKNEHPLIFVSQR